MAVITDVSDPKANSGTAVTSITADGAIVAGYYINSSGKYGGFVETIATQTFTDVSDPYAVAGTLGGGISADGATLAGYYVNSSFGYVGFVETIATQTYTDVSDPNAVAGTLGGVISADGSTVAGYYFSGPSVLYGRVGFVENVATQTFTDVSDPNVSDPSTDGGTVVKAISANGAIVAGNYVGAGASAGFVENVATQTYTDVSDPNAVYGTFVNAISADGATVAGYYVNGLHTSVGFVENVATHGFNDVIDPSTDTDTVVNAISADGSTVAGYYTSGLYATGYPTNVGFVENLATHVFTNVIDPNAVSGDNTLYPGTTVNSTHNGTIIDAISADGATVAGHYVNSSGADVGFVASDLACYCRGALILTDHGEVAVENLRIGDLVVTASGEARPIKWIGHRKVDCARHPDPTSVWPIRVAADAFARDKPSRDLWLSPGHNIEVEGALAPIGAFVNGKSITQIERPSVEYWHIELDRHDILIAQGLPAESYLDTGNRTAFANGGAFVDAHPDFKPRHWAETCLPLVNAGPRIVRARTLLLERLKDNGHVTTTESDLHVMADGERIEPMKLGAMRFAFLLPADRADIRLKSRTFVPAHTVASRADTRALGVCVVRFQIDGEEIALANEAHFGEGWHHLEPGLRWTRGDPPLPANTRLVVIDLAGEGCYWRDQPTDPIVALFG
jgi:hypothetical protein